MTQTNTRRDFIEKFISPKKNEVKDNFLRTQTPTTGLNEYTGVFGKAELMHLLRRCTFGLKPSYITQFQSQSLNDVVEYLFLPNNTNIGLPLNNYSQTDPDVPYGTSWVNLNGVNSVFDGERIASLKSWITGIHQNQPPNILDKITMFWHNHMPIEATTVSTPVYLYRNYMLLRGNALGNFKNLIKQVTIDAAMLKYLNGDLNNRNAPDENYARELQELFCVGKGVGALYTEDDVKAAAQVLTGWQVTNSTATVSFNINRHVTTNKQFSSFYSNTIIQGRSDANAGNDELDDLLTMIFSVEEVSKYICRELYRWFVYYEIDETVEQNVIEPLALIFRNNNYGIAPTLKTLLKSEHFFDSLNKGIIIKSPLDLTHAAIKELNVTIPNTTFDVEYAFYETISGFNLVIQQDLYGQPNVSGWSAYYQEPTFYRNWINTSSMSYRKKMIDGITTWFGITPFDSNYSTYNIHVDAIAYIQQFPNPDDPALLIQQLVDFLLPNDVSQEQKDFMRISILLNNQTTNYYWTQIWNLYLADPNNATYRDYVFYKSHQLINYICNLAEYQLM